MGALARRPYLVLSREDGALLGGTGLVFETPYRAATGYVLLTCLLARSRRSDRTRWNLTV